LKECDRIDAEHFGERAMKAAAGHAAFGANLGNMHRPRAGGFDIVLGIPD
jgi:hypothetical protein